MIPPGKNAYFWAEGEDLRKWWRDTFTQAKETIFGRSPVPGRWIFKDTQEKEPAQSIKF